MREFLSSPSFYLGLTVFNGFACLSSIMNGSWFWAGVSGVFTLMCISSWRALK